MSSVTDPQPDPNADEIVAYLDGELPPQDCRRVETRLATDEEFRQEMHELDRAWDALDVLPTPTVDDGFARTTIELACVAAEADLSDNVAAAKSAAGHRKWRWVVAGLAAAVFGFLIGGALLPHRNGQLLADLPAIDQLNVLPYVESVDFLRLLGTTVPQTQFVKDKPAFDRNVADLASVNDASFETRRKWIQSLPAEQKAELSDRTRTFNDLGPNSEKREQMRKIMDEIRGSKDATTLQDTLAAYGQWLSRHSGAQQERLHEQLDGLPAEEQVAVVQKAMAGDDDQRYRHLSFDDAAKLRESIIEFATERHPGIMGARKGSRGPRSEEQRIGEAAGVVIRELLQEKDNAKRAAMEERLANKLTPELQDHLKSLPQGSRPFDMKFRQTWIWIREATDPKATPGELEEFFASDALPVEKRQELLEKPWTRMEAELKYYYFTSTLGIQNPPPIFGDPSEPGRMPWGGPDMGPPRDGGPRFGPGRDFRPEGPPGDHRRNRPPRTPGDGPPMGQKPEAI